MLHQTQYHRIERMQSHQINDTTWLLANQFIRFNPLWKDYNVPLELAFQFIRPKLLTPYIESDSLVILDANNKIVGCVIQQDMYTYIQQSKKLKTKVSHPLFDKLKQIEQELEGDLFKQEFIQGEVMYGGYVCVDKTEQNTDISKLIQQVAYLLNQQKGIKWLYTRVTHPSQVKQLTLLNFEVFKQVTVIRQDKNKTPLEIYLMRCNFKKPLQEQSLL